MTSSPAQRKVERLRSESARLANQIADLDKKKAHKEQEPAKALSDLERGR